MLYPTRSRSPASTGAYSPVNGGEPLWPIAKLHPSYDPVALLAFTVSTALGPTGIIAFSFVLLGWLCGFALGGRLLARTVGLSVAARLLVFVVLMWSSLAVLMLYQSQYLVIVRFSCEASAPSISHLGAGPIFRATPRRGWSIACSTCATWVRSATAS